MTVKNIAKIFGGFFLLGCTIFGNGCAPNPVEKALRDGNAFEENGQYTQAMAEYNHALELDSQSTDAYYNRGLLYQKQGNSKAAFADFNKIIAMNPNYSEPYYGCGQIYDGQGQTDMAIVEYTKAIENNVNYGLAYYKRCLDYNSKGEYRKALDDAEKVRGMGMMEISEDFFKQLKENASRQK